MGVLERKQREKANRQQAILAAAKTVFLAKGLVAATIEDIAAEAELGMGNLYRHYASKKEIMLAISELAFQDLHHCYTAAVAEGGSGLDKMLRTTQAYFKFTMDNPACFGFIAFLNRHLPAGHPSSSLRLPILSIN